MRSFDCAAIIVCNLLSTLAAVAGEADVVDAAISCRPDNTCTVVATVRHNDSGWEHYADHFRVLTANGREIGRRVLYHPHVDEQPFTRSLSSIELPADRGPLSVEAHDSVHGYGGQHFQLDIPAR